jgi:hypothetical protein
MFLEIVSPQTLHSNFYPIISVCAIELRRTELRKACDASRLTAHAYTLPLASLLPAWLVPLHTDGQFKQLAAMRMSCRV